MRELTRTNDPVFLSYLTAELTGEGIESLVLDAFASTLLAPMNATALQRVMVDEDDYWNAWGVLAEAEERVSENSLLDGRLILLQPKDGFRAAIDPILLAAAVPVKSGDRVLDVGSGSGASALALLARQPWAWVVGLDIQQSLIALANRSALRNSLRNKMHERATFTAGDIASPQVRRDLGMFDHVMSNPPFYAKGSGQIPQNRARAMATIESTVDLPGWIASMLDVLRDRGTITLIHRIEREAEVIDALRPHCGDIAVQEISSKAQNGMRKLVLIQAVKGLPTSVGGRSTLVLHQANGDFTDAALAILRDACHAPICST